MSDNLSMDKGTTRTVRATISNLDASGVAGWDFWFTAKNNLTDDDVDAVIQKVTADFTIVDPGNDTTPAIVTCEITPIETTGLPDYPTILVYDVKGKKPDTREYKLGGGKLKINPTATKAI